MITIHITIYDRINRAIPIIGIPIFIYQAKIALVEAQAEDVAYVHMMKEMEQEPKEKLLNHSVKQEWFLIVSLSLTLLLTWFLSCRANFLFYTKPPFPWYASPRACR